MSLLILTTLFLLFASAVASLVLKAKNGWFFVLSTFIISVSIATFILTGLGIFNAMTAGNYFLAVLFLLILSIVWMFWRKKEIFEAANDLKNYIKGLGPIRVSIAVLLLAILLFWGARLAATPIWDYDSIAYHLPFTANFIQEESAREIYFSALSGPIGYYPSGFEILAAHFLIFFKADSLLNALNLIFAALTFLAFFLIGRELKAAKFVSLAAALAFASMPLFLSQIGTLKIDIFFTLVFGALILFLIRYVKENKFADALMFGLCSGLMLGSRYLAVPYLTLPWVVFLISPLLCKRRVGEDFKNSLHYKIPPNLPFLKGGKTINFLTAIFSAFLIGGYWYARNWILTGNPIFPTEVSLFDKQIFEGLGASFSSGIFATSILDNVKTWQGIKLLDHYFVQTGLVLFATFWAIVFLPLVFWRSSSTSFLSFPRKRGSRLKKNLDPRLRGDDNFLLIFLSGLLLFFSFLFYIYLYVKAPYTFIHFDQNIRYSMPALFLGLAVVLLVSGALKSKWFNLGAILVLLLISGFNVWLFIKYPQPNFTFGSDLKEFGKRDVFYLNLQNVYTGFWPVIETMGYLDGIAPKDAKIGYSGFHFHYPLFGPDLARRVDYIAVNKCFKCDYLDYKKEEGNIFVRPDFDSWLANLRRYQKEYYIFYPQGGYPEYEWKWLADNPKMFELLYRVEDAYLYKIKP
ncbi:MAG: hypothetical protein UV40_C0035G0004 [Parcubacteria group bacterium GW2011_GWA1_42_7]|nr:MAG: hypothetical protein UV40_C0035G0004 [Parcubacteria group bacterium GW2011_GWA1_42_7]KKS91904.1 MAG: hypothetical protein UV67_C0015G0023 [Parcubacteria group bacterium GW2011_GWC1_43_12]